MGSVIIYVAVSPNWIFVIAWTLFIMSEIQSTSIVCPFWEILN